MALPQGINFRGSLAFVTDGATESAEYAGGSVTYPRTTAQGVTVGTESNLFNNANRTTSFDPRLAGIYYTSSAGPAFRIDLPSSGSYNVRIAAGDGIGPNRSEWDLYDSTTLLANLTTGSTVAGHFKDAQNVDYAAASWPGSNSVRNFTFSSTICRLKSAVTTGNTVLAHFYVESAAPAPPIGTYAASLGNATLSASGSVLANATGTLTSALDNATMAASGLVADPGVFATTMVNATMVASGSVGTVPSGAFAASLGSIVMAATGTINDTGSFATNLGGVSMAAAGVVAANPAGTYATTMADATMYAGGYVGTPPVLTGVILRRRQRPNVFQRTSS